MGVWQCDHHYINLILTVSEKVCRNVACGLTSDGGDSNTCGAGSGSDKDHHECS
jgi:hypothetical protein